MELSQDSESESVTSIKEYKNGHCTVKKTFHKPAYCHHCSDILWGLIKQGYICEGNAGKTKSRLGIISLLIFSPVFISYFSLQLCGSRKVLKPNHHSLLKHSPESS